MIKRLLPLIVVLGVLTGNSRAYATTFVPPNGDAPTETRGAAAR